MDNSDVMENFDALYENVNALLANMKNSFESIVAEKDSLGNQYKSLQFAYEKEAQTHKDCRDKLEEIMKENERMRPLISALEGELADTQRQNEKMRTQISVLEDDRAQFAKVSHIIALEKDNAKLKAELDAHKARLAATMTTTIASTTKALESPPIVEPIIEAADEEPEDPEESSFYEKKIKGVVYFVGETTSNIYKKIGDDEIGDLVGRLEKDEKTKKTKVVWNI